jgi:hypothetical protein
MKEIEIRHRRVPGVYGYERLAREYGMPINSVRDIVLHITRHAS